jgi:hypothetical protein
LECLIIWDEGSTKLLEEIGGLAHLPLVTGEDARGRKGGAEEKAELGFATWESSLEDDSF